MRAPSRLRTGALLALVGIALAASAPVASAAPLDTSPPAGVPATVAADLLPTAQINGVVWSQVTVGNTVYATGDFTKARPAGAAAGQNEVTRTRLLAYDLTTGALTGFTHSLNGRGRVVVASPDGSRIYVGGDFTSVDGTARGHLAAFDTATGALVPGFAPALNSGVRALAASASTVYAGGTFTAVGSAVRTRLAAFTAAGALTSWAPSADAVVAAMTLTPDRSKVVVGGSFASLGGAPAYGLGAVDATTGAAVRWASQSSAFPIRDYGTNAGITSLSADATSVYLTGFNYGAKARPGGFEGRAAISPADGSLRWANDCHGDSYSAIPLGSVLYSVGHPHDCQPAGYFPQTTTPQRALAETLIATHRDGPATHDYTSHEGEPASDQLVWYPTLTPGTYTGQGQAAWSVTGNASYVSLGGEFTAVNGVRQQGLARFAVRSLAPNRVGPDAFVGFAPTVSGTTVSFSGTSDRDNAALTYTVHRDGGTAAVWTGTARGTFWARPAVRFTDPGIAPGSTHTYRVVATDPLGNSVTSPTVRSVVR